MLEKTKYDVKPGFDWVSGAPVPANRTVELTDTEARFDLEQGRIAPQAPGRKPAPRVADTELPK